MEKRLKILLGGSLLISYQILSYIGGSVAYGYFDRLTINIGFILIFYGIFYHHLNSFFEKTSLVVESKPYQVLAALLIISLIIRLFFLPIRWINPDEGAHLYDAQFVLDGKIPYVDYNSRMPFYVYLLASFLRIFGSSYVSGRLMVLFFNLGIGLIIFGIGSSLFNKKTGVIAAGIYLFLPLSILWSVVVKTEIPETFFAASGFFVLIKGLQTQNNNNINIVASGAIFALAYYIRKSAILFPFLALIIIILYSKPKLKGFKSFIPFITGYSFVVLLFLIFFSSHQGFAATVDSHLNPLQVALDPIYNLPKMSNSTTVGLVDSRLRHDFKPLSSTYREWKWVAKLNMFLFFGPALVFPMLMKQPNDENDKNIKTSLFLLLIWFFGTTTFYLYYSFKRGFFNQYFGEMIPSLSLIFAFAFDSKTWSKFSVKPLWSKDLILLLSLALYSTSISFISPSYSAVWSPKTLIIATSTLSETPVKNSNELMSGAVIWSFQSGIPPFMNITHPLGFRGYGEPEMMDKIARHMVSSPPQFIVMDGYTEQTYLKQVPGIENKMNSSYRLINEINGSYYPVRIYELSS